MPGCPKYFIFLGVCLFVIPVGVYLSNTGSSAKNNKLSYSVMHAFAFGITSLVYFLYPFLFFKFRSILTEWMYVLVHKITRKREEIYRAREDARDAVKGGMPSKLAYWLCFFPSIDSDTVHVMLILCPIIIWKNGELNN